MIDAHAHLESLVCQTVYTLTGRRPNRILRVERQDVIVAAERSPSGNAVPIQWVQDAFDVLERDGSIEVSVDSLGYRSAFVGAVLATLPGATVESTTPRRVTLRRS